MGFPIGSYIIQCDTRGTIYYGHNYRYFEIKDLILEKKKDGGPP